jgi:hypothetical protein
MTAACPAHCSFTQIDAQLAVRHAEAIERTKSTKLSAFFGSSREVAKGTNENDPAQEDGEGTLVSSSAVGESPRKRSKIDADIMEKVSFIFLFSHLM